MDLDNRSIIVQTLSEFKDTGFAKVFDKWHFYFNKQSIMLTNVDENGKSLETVLPIKINKDGGETRAKSISLKPVKIVQAATDDSQFIELTDFEISTFDKSKFNSLDDYFENYLRPIIADLDYKEMNLKVITEKAIYWYDADQGTIIEEAKGKQKVLGCGKIVIKANLKKLVKSKEALITISVELTPDYQKDYEIIPYSPNPEENQRRIADFMAKYITKPFEYLDNVIGAEINFNKVFHKPEQLREVPEIVNDLQVVENVLKNLENELAI